MKTGTHTQVPVPMTIVPQVPVPMTILSLPPFRVTYINFSVINIL